MGGQENTPHLPNLQSLGLHQQTHQQKYGIGEGEGGGPFRLKHMRNYKMDRNMANISMNKLPVLHSASPTVEWHFPLECLQQIIELHSGSLSSAIMDSQTTVPFPSTPYLKSKKVNLSSAYLSRWRHTCHISVLVLHG